jgi:catechol 2,3-dioxygenase-like lactoylglutathione lyase family enzyme
MQGLRHVALFVSDMARSLAFYQDVIGMELEWMPDPDNAYLTSGTDNLALHRRGGSSTSGGDPVLDHIGFLVARAGDVDAWARYLTTQGIPLSTPPTTHRDGARSLYLEDPDGIRIQVIFHPPISEGASHEAGPASRTPRTSS